MELSILANTKSISFNKYYEKEYKFLMEQSNPSSFVCELIRKHMQGDDNFENKVKDVLIRYLSLNNIQTIQPNVVNPPSSKIEEIEDPWG